MNQHSFLLPITRLACGLAALCMSAGGHADTLYKCKDGSGAVLYTNQKGSAKNCIVLSHERPTPTAAPPPRPMAPPRTSTPANFPRIDGGTQRERDNDRRRILEQEFATEQQSLEKTRTALADAEATRPSDEKAYQKHRADMQELRTDMAVHERNLNALKRELANLK